MTALPLFSMYSLKQKKVLTYYDLIERYREEAIYLFYLGDQFCINRFISSPFKDRSDSDPSFKLRYKDNMLLWYDYGDHKTGYPASVVGFVMRYYEIDNYQDALAKVVEDMKDFTITSDILKEVDLIRLKSGRDTKKGAVLRPRFEQYELDFWESILVKEPLLKEYRTYAAKETYIDGKLWRKSSKYDPVFAYVIDDDPKNYSMQWYRPFAESKKNKFRDHNTDGKIFGLKQLPKNGEVLIITKSCKDVLVLRALGFWAICPFGESSYIHLLAILPDLISRFDKVFVMYDPDKTGMEYSKLITSKFEGALINITIPEDLEKDPTDNVKAGKTEQFLTFLNAQINSESN